MTGPSDHACLGPWGDHLCLARFNFVHNNYRLSWGTVHVHVVRRRDHDMYRIPDKAHNNVHVACVGDTCGQPTDKLYSFFSSPKSCLLMGRSRRKRKQVQYTGGKDQLGAPHGRGTEKWPSGDVFSGRFHHGEKEGRGTWYFSDGSCLSGRFVASVIQGPGRYSFPDGSFLEGHYFDGQLNGAAKEVDSFGNVKFVGEFRDGVKHGKCLEIIDDFGGFLFGWVDSNGLWSGKNVAYVYPDGITALLGTISEGIFCCGHLAEFRGTKEEYLSAKVCQLDDDRVFRRFVSCEKTLTKWPLMRDPYEEKTVFAAPSRIHNAGEGLFAKRDLNPGELAAFYNGIRLSHEVVDGRHWNANGNCISLDKDSVIDVPEDMSSTSQYCASLGHKANHSFDPNARYAPCEHPCFGRIKCIQAIKLILSGDEITVDYDYHHEIEGEQFAPDWYLKAKQAHLQTTF